jgi:hypothetical protein
MKSPLKKKLRARPSLFFFLAAHGQQKQFRAKQEEAGRVIYAPIPNAFQ